MGIKRRHNFFMLYNLDCLNRETLFFNTRSRIFPGCMRKLVIKIKGVSSPDLNDLKMKNMLVKKMLPLITLFLFFLSCNDKNNTPPPDTASDITITQPATGLTFLNGSVIQVRGVIIDNNGISAAKIEIRNKTTGALYFGQQTPTPYVTYYNFSWDWTVTGITAVTPAVIKITCIDKYNYEVSEEIDINLSN
jgi:hypothetical protein